MAKQRSRSSLMWKYFVQIEDKCKCLLCNHLIAFSGNTSNMKTHLTNMHPEILGGKKQKQTKISQFAFSKTKKDLLDRELAILSASRSLALNLVETKEFKRFMSVAVPGYQTPSVKTLKKNHLFPMTKKLRQKITEDSSNQKFALTTDLWSNLKQEAFLGLTCHFIHGTKKKNVTLECTPFERDHDNTNIREKVS